MFALARERSPGDPPPPIAGITAWYPTFQQQLADYRGHPECVSSEIRLRQWENLFITAGALRPGPPSNF